MYRHLLVPLDDSPLVGRDGRKAVRLARTLGAKVTFFHAQEDYGAIEHRRAAARDLARGCSTSTWPAKRARSWRRPKSSRGRPAFRYDSCVVTSNRPYEAILQRPSRAAAT